jgi:hypothetical protein
VRGRAAALVCSGLLIAAGARAELVRGTLKIDVRDAGGAAKEAAVSVRAAGGGETRKLERAGEVYVADGLLDGDWVIEVAGAASQTVRVSGRRVVGVVAVIGEATKKRKKAPFTVGPDEPACDAADGALIEAIAFARGGGLGAGRLEVRKGAKLVCAATIAGGGASLRLPPGEYAVSAQFVGGGVAKIAYRFKAAPAPALVLRSR